MASETDDGGARGPVVWALAVREMRQGPPVAELIVEVGAGLHADLVGAAVDSGFTVAAGEPPETSGAVEVAGGRVRRLVLVGGRQGWEPGSPVEASPGWLAAAGQRGRAVVTILPPHTRPPVPGPVPGPAEQDAEARIEARIEEFTRRLEREQRAGRVLHGTVAVHGTR
ncbi:hypothetical protein GCM10018790_77490 [Kitasatospora xanthocidica]|uniref:hypothetical protein n=1 Tax=Kitasatospora xanthocidica TaxID=83382 RepID=UPI00167211DA|nr:hypothetical protein [Kitasatospora xanthocidica]GHF88562.1 hypothetical protein GCM10018790_77490 [Kitasatospora xanthocidica]